MSRAKSERNESDAGNERGHQYRTQPFKGALNDRLPKRKTFPGEVLIVGDEHDAVSRRDAEQRNKADERRNREGSTGEEHHDHSTDERQRQVGHDQ